MVLRRLKLESRIARLLKDASWLLLALQILLDSLLVSTQVWMVELEVFEQFELRLFWLCLDCFWNEEFVLSIHQSFGF